MPAPRPGAAAGPPTGADGADPVRVVVGRIARAHGVRGEVAVDVRTDDPAARFAPGAVLSTAPAAAGPLRVDAARAHGERLLVRFSGVSDRDTADALRGVRLLVDPLAEPPADDPDAFYDHELEGLEVRTTDGATVGTVREVVHLPAHDLLQVRRAGRSDVLVPFAAAVVVDVDLAAGSLLLDPPDGLLD